MDDEVLLETNREFVRVKAKFDLVSESFRKFRESSTFSWLKQNFVDFQGHLENFIKISSWVQKLGLDLPHNFHIQPELI